MKIIIFYLFLLIIVFPVLFNKIFINETVENFKGKKGKKGKKDIIYNLNNDNGSYNFISGNTTIEIMPSNKSNKISDIYFHYRSLPDKTIANGNQFEDKNNRMFTLKTPKNKYTITYSSSSKPISILVNEHDYVIDIEKTKDTGKYNIIWYNKIVGTISDYTIKLDEPKLDNIEIIMTIYTALLIVDKMKNLDLVDYNKIFK